MKIAWVYEEHFIPLEKHKRCLEHLNYIYEQTFYLEDENILYDLEGLSIIGESGCGKTTIYSEFIRQHLPTHLLNRENKPILYAILKNSVTGEKGLYSALIAPLNHPFGSPDSFRRQRITIDQLEETLLHLLRIVRTRMYVIDEFQHIKGRNQQAILDQLKRTMLISQIPFVPMGTLEVAEFINLDIQLSDRCPIRSYSRLDYWDITDGQRLEDFTNFHKFLTSYERYLPFPEPSGLSSTDFALKIAQKVAFRGGNFAGQMNIRNIVRFLKKVSVVALKRNHSQILEEDLDYVMF